MKTFVTLSIVVLLAGVAGFYFWKNGIAEEHEPMAFCPEETWLIFQTADLGAFYADLTDSNSIYYAVPSILPTVAGLNELLAPFSNERVPAHIFVSGNPLSQQFTVVVGNEIAKNLDLNGFEVVEESGFSIVSSDPIASYSSPERIHEIKRATLGINSAEIVFLARPALELIFLSSFQSEPNAFLSQEFSDGEWMAFEINDQALFTATSMVHQTKDESKRKNATHLLRMLPSEVETALLVGTEQQVFGLVSCPYQLHPEQADHNLFVIIESNDTVVPSDLSIQAQALNDAGIQFKPSWSENAFAVKIGNATVYGSSKSQMERFLNDYIGFNRLTDTKAYQRLSESISDASLTLFVRTPTKQSESVFFQEISTDNKINSFILQVHSELAERKLFSLSIIHNETIKDELPEIWKCVLDKEVLAGPWPFKNHYTNEGEVLVQDKLNQLYLINKDGKILWKKQLDQPIQGEIQMIDAFRSGKTQMLFATTKRLHLIDRNGNNVEGFPIKFEDENNVAPSAITYTKGGDYRILISDGTSLKNYGVDGKSIAGWKAPDLKSTLTQPIRFLSYAGKDYLMAICANNKVQLYDRTGLSRSEAIVFPPHIGEIAFNERPSLKDCELIACDSNGNVLIKKFDGNLRTEALLPVSNNLLFTYNSVGNHTQVAVLENHLLTFDKDENVLLDHLFSESMSNLKWIWKERSWLALSDAKQNQLFLVDAEKGILDKMPVKGDIHAITLDLEGQGIRALVTHIGNGELVAYRISY